jgi:hypothetical protein
VRTVSDRKCTKLLKAIHNRIREGLFGLLTVSDRKCTKLLKAIHNRGQRIRQSGKTVSDRKDTTLLRRKPNQLRLFSSLFDVSFFCLFLRR